MSLTQSGLISSTFNMYVKVLMLVLVFTLVSAKSVVQENEEEANRKLLANRFYKTMDNIKDNVGVQLEASKSQLTKLTERVDNAKVEVKKFLKTIQKHEQIGPLQNASKKLDKLKGQLIQMNQNLDKEEQEVEERVNRNLMLSLRKAIGNMRKTLQEWLDGTKRKVCQLTKRVRDAQEETEKIQNNIKESIEQIAKLKQKEIELENAEKKSDEEKDDDMLLQKLDADNNLISD